MVTLTILFQCQFFVDCDAQNYGEDDTNPICSNLWSHVDHMDSSSIKSDSPVRLTHITDPFRLSLSLTHSVMMCRKIVRLTHTCKYKTKFF